MQAYRTAAAGAVRNLASALFGRELLAVEAAKTSAAERERMLEGRAKELFDSQVYIGVWVARAGPRRGVVRVAAGNRG